MRTFRLHNCEKEFLQEFLNGAIKAIGRRDATKCAEYACHAILTNKTAIRGAKGNLRPIVLDKIKGAGVELSEFYLNAMDHSWLYPTLYAESCYTWSQKIWD